MTDSTADIREALGYPMCEIIRTLQALQKDFHETRAYETVHVSDLIGALMDLFTGPGAFKRVMPLVICEEDSRVSMRCVVCPDVEWKFDAGSHTHNGSVIDIMIRHALMHTDFRNITHDTTDEEIDFHETPIESITDSELIDLLSLVCVTVSREQIHQWDRGMKIQAAKWAGLTHLSASDNDVEVPPRPKFLTDSISGTLTP